MSEKRGPAACSSTAPSAKRRGGSLSAGGDAEVLAGLLRAEAAALPPEHTQEGLQLVQRWVDAERAACRHLHAQSHPQAIYAPGIFGYSTEKSTGSSELFPPPANHVEKVIFNAITQHGGAQKSFVSDDANDTSSVDPLARVLAVTSKDCRVALRRCWDLAERQCITMGQLMKVLDALPPASRQAFHCGTLRNACVARRSPIEATDFLTLATEPYCEPLKFCTGCGVTAYCGEAHRLKDEASHSGWCRELLLSRLLWQVVCRPHEYDELRRRTPAPFQYHCVGRAAVASEMYAGDGVPKLPAGWGGFFEEHARVPAAVTCAVKIEDRDAESTQSAVLGQLLSSEPLSSVMTVAYSCHRLGLVLHGQKQLCVWIVGACFEIDQPWEELLAWLPTYVELVKVVFLGPDVGEPDYSQPGAPTVSCDGNAEASLPIVEKRPVTASLVGTRLEYHRLRGIYHWLTAAQRSSLPTPDLAVALNSGSAPANKCACLGVCFIPTLLAKL